MELRKQSSLDHLLASLILCFLTMSLKAVKSDSYPTRIWNFPASPTCSRMFSSTCSPQITEHPTQGGFSRKTFLFPLRLLFVQTFSNKSRSVPAQTDCTSLYFSNFAPAVDVTASWAADGERYPKCGLCASMHCSGGGVGSGPVAAGEIYEVLRMLACSPAMGN